MSETKTYRCPEPGCEEEFESRFRMGWLNRRVLGKNLTECEGSIGEIKFRLRATGKSRR